MRKKGPQRPFWAASGLFFRLPRGVILITRLVCLLTFELISSRFQAMLSRDEVLKIAQLARLELSETELTQYQQKLGRVLDYVKDLDSVDLNDVVGFARHIPQDAKHLRNDVEIEFHSSQDLLKNAPQLQEHQFCLPVTVERSE